MHFSQVIDPYDHSISTFVYVLCGNRNGNIPDAAHSDIIFAIIMFRTKTSLSKFLWIIRFDTIAKPNSDLKSCIITFIIIQLQDKNLNLRIQTL